MFLDVALLDPQSTRNAGASRTTKAKPLEVGSIARRMEFLGRVGISRGVVRHGADRCSLVLLPSFELVSSLSNLRLNLSVAPAENLRDRLSEGRLIGKPGLKRRRA